MFKGDFASPEPIAADPSIKIVADRRDGICPDAACLTCPSRSTGLCGHLDIRKLDEFFRNSSRLSVSSGHELIRQDEPARHLQIVVTGGLTFSRLASDGRRFVTGFAWPGDFVGLVFEEKSPFSAFALGSTEVCCHPHAAFNELIDSSPRLARSLLMRIYEELSVAQDHMVLLGCGNARERVALFLVRLQERQRRTGKMSPRINLPMRRSDVASHLGLTVETVSRIFQDFVRKKIIMVIPDGVRILSRETLVMIAGATHEDVSSLRNFLRY